MIFKNINLDDLFQEVSPEAMQVASDYFVRICDKPKITDDKIETKTYVRKVQEAFKEE